MPKYLVIKGSYGEGYVPGDVIEMDAQAASVRLQLGDLIYHDGELENLKPVEEIDDGKKFCEHCDSKGGRHKKDCPTQKEDE